MCWGAHPYFWFWVGGWGETSEGSTHWFLMWSELGPILCLVSDFNGQRTYYSCKPQTNPRQGHWRSSPGTQPLWGTPDQGHSRLTWICLHAHKSRDRHIAFPESRNRCITVPVSKGRHITFPGFRNRYITFPGSKDRHITSPGPEIAISLFLDPEIAMSFS